jgi:TrpR-related protein YerC/YecD
MSDSPRTPPEHRDARRPCLPADLLDALTRMQNAEEMTVLLDDLLTPQEIEALAERWHIAQALRAGSSQRDIAQKLGVSVTTVSRGSRQLQYGTGGFALAFERLANTNRERGD